MLANKWILLVLNVAVVVLGYLGTLNWDSYWPTNAGAAIMIIGALKAMLAVLMPAPGQTVGATGKFLITHRTA